MKMYKHTLFACAMIAYLAIAPIHGRYYSESESVNPTTRSEKMTRLHFFFHDILSGENPTSVLIARPNTTDKSIYLNLFAMDDPLTVGPEPTSAVIGNAPGLTLAISRDLSSYGAVLYADFEFTTGKFNGSSFCLFSRYPTTEFVRAKDTVREMGIVGGRGAFRMARGFALVRAVFADVMTGDSILEFNVTLYHY